MVNFHATISPKQCRAARAWLSWKQVDLAEASGVTQTTIAQFESGGRVSSDQTLQKLRVAFEAAGIEFMFERMVGKGLFVK